ncbi:flippase [Aeromonas caviae]|uniref:flippase n=1 Tax=Aeromonas caviae TaxID=648 RepID=UPI0029D78188|nr:flippase [Aeromonas caviae]MDX7681757.1 flippase [Aeromonas caviae]MDX7813183.1 flippase [Aeromonas caviae]
MSLVKHSALNIVGNFVPALVTLPAYGYLARTLGVELFGIYTLAIIIVGYAGIFDVGLTRAIIREIALYRNNKAEQRKIIGCGTISIVLFSFIAMFIMYVFAPKIVGLLNVSLDKENDAIASLSLLALSIPIFLLNQVWLAILEGNEDFVQLNIQRFIGSLFFAAFPVAFVYQYQDIFFAILGLFIARVITLIISGFMVKDDIIGAGLSFDSKIFKRLIGFGGWSALTGIISPILVYFDRFILANILGAKFVAFYSAPAELISKGLIVPNSLARSIFPKLITASCESDKKNLIKMGYILMVIVCGSGTILGLILADFVMTTWMGDSFSGEPVIVLRILLIGFFFNSLAQIPFSEIQAKGKSKITALVHIIEIVPYITIIYLLVHSFGVIGAAMAWSIRVVFDFIVLLYLSYKC